jgi:superfamily II DNA or RNA helicase
MKTKKQSTDKVNNTRRQFLQCARKLQDWGPQFTIAKEHMFTKPEFRPSKVLEALEKGASPKIVKLLETIKELDAADLKTHGNLFKHFIFSDVDEGNYGARMVISSLIASGFTNMIPDMRSILPPTGDTAKKTFVYLSSKPVAIKGHEVTFDGYVQAYDVHGRPLKIDEDKNVGLTGPKNYRPSMKKYVTDSFNDSANKYGDHIRFIVLDKKFKEGLDLFDVKYAHLMEAMSPSETKQAEGRGTRNCGQKNLEFKTNEGWALHVYHYLLRLPKEFASGYGWSHKYEEMIKTFSDADDRTEMLTNQFTQLAEKVAVDRALSHALLQQYVKRGGMTLRSGTTYAPVSYQPRERKAPVTTLALRDPEPVTTLALRDPEPVTTLALREPEPVTTLALREPEPVTTLALRKPEIEVRPETTRPETTLAIRHEPIRHINPFVDVPSTLTKYSPTKYAPPPQISQIVKQCDAVNTTLPSRSEFCQMSADEQQETYNDLRRQIHPDHNPTCPSVAKGMLDELNSLRECDTLQLKDDKYSAWDDVKDVAGTIASTGWDATKQVGSVVASAGLATGKAVASAGLATGKAIASNAYHGTRKIASYAKDAGIGLAKYAWNKTRNAWRRKSPQVPRQSPQSPPKSLEDQIYQKLKPVSDAQIASLNINNPPLTEFQRSIARTYGHADLPKLPIESDCTRPKPIEGVVQSKRQAAKLNMTQDFLRRYVRPETNSMPTMVTKGMLLWHSTGSGKTCTAAAIASNFEEAGYIVVYVCPGSLTSEIKKNVWESVICHGKNLKEHWNKLQDIESKYDSNWLGGPMSYKTFTNLVQGLAGKGGGNKALMEKLYTFDARHGISAKQRMSDPFYKMLIIIDEAQKLYSNELGTLEQPHMPTVETYLQKSYSLNAEDASYQCARVILMTATPISKSPFELFQLLNLLRPKSDALPLTDAEFKASKLVNEKGETNNAAVMEKLQGYISYLDLSNNRTRFAQKVHHEIEVPISGNYEPVLPPFDKKAMEEEKKKLVERKLAECTGSKAACNKRVKNDPEVFALDSQLKRPKTKKVKYDKTKQFTQLDALQECASKYLNETPKVYFYPSPTNKGEYPGFKYLNGPKGLGYYSNEAEPAQKVALQVAESITDVQKELEAVYGTPVKIDTDFVYAPTRIGRYFPGWTYRDGPKGKGYYLTDFKDKTFVPSDNNRGSISGWIYRKGVEGLGYYASSIGRAIGDRIADKLGYTRKN